MKLHTAYPDNAGYAHGWIAYDNPFASGKALFHSGSNTYWWAQLWLAPERDFAMMVFCNLGGTAASNAANDVFNELSETYLGESAGE